ncbi:MAG: tRNA (adenosine(37)-N6)-threonylcarbamoyltransferase complex dimerization subunit type 1 TsaB [Chlorobium sp.]
MNILAIECTHAALSAAVMKSSIVTEAKSSDWKKAVEALVPLIEEVMEGSRLKPQELKCIAVSSGPGSFTSLRIGMSVAKGIAYGLGIPLIPVPTLPAMAASLTAEAGSVMAVIQARKGEYYYAAYFPDDLLSGLWHDGVHRGSAIEIISAVARANSVVVGRQLDELGPLLADIGAIYAEADFFSARSLFPAAERGYGTAVAAELDKVVPDYRQMFIPHVGRE